MNRNKIILFTLFIIIALLAASLGLQRLYYYKKVVKFRLDPLEESALNSNLDFRKNKFWILGDSRAASWDPSYLEFITISKNNLAIGGQSTKQVLERFRNDLEIAQPEYVLLQVGINDLKSIGFLKDKYITQNCINNTIRILELCRKNNINVIYTSIFPVGDIEFFRRPLWKNNVYDSIQKVNSTIKTYCDNNNFLFFDAYSLLLSGPGSRNTRKEFQEDFLHLNEKGYLFLSGKLEENFKLQLDTVSAR